MGGDLKMISLDGSTTIVSKIKTEFNHVSKIHLRTSNTTIETITWFGKTSQNGNLTDDDRDGAD